MKNYKYIFGPVPSRRLGISLGISPIPKKYCNYSCIYCQLGRTGKLTNKREEFYGVSEIIDELKSYLQNNIQFDVISIVGEGEPTLYLNIGELIHEIRNLTDKPIAVITNGALLIDSEVRGELANADIVLPSLDAYDEKSFKLINRPHGTISFSKTIEGLQIFSEEFKGQMWIEVMLIKGINDSEKNLSSIRDILTTIAYDRLYINSPVRPPAEEDVQEVSKETLKMAIDILDGISIDQLATQGFSSVALDDYSAIKSIIKRHPMNQHEIESFLTSRRKWGTEELLTRLEQDNEISVIEYKGYKTYRMK